MNWNEKLQTILDYVEEHLQRREEPINKNEIAEMAGCSYALFQKIFAYMNEISFAEYVRNRKLTLAGYDLKSSNIKVIELSYKYGYDSPTSFTKAFQQFHGVTPKAARMMDAQLKICPKMSFTKASTIAWRLEKKPAFRLIGKSLKLRAEDEQNYQLIPAFWNQCQQDGTTFQLMQKSEGNPPGIFGLFDQYDEHSISYKIMSASNAALQADWCEVTLPAQTWAVFDCYGTQPYAIQRGWDFLHNEWLVKYPFKHEDCPELEWYSEGNVYSKDYLSQIWIPIIEEE